MNPLKFEDFEKSLERRKANLGFTGANYVMPNSGVNRTPEKRELLRALRAIAVERGVETMFEENI